MLGILAAPVPATIRAALDSDVADAAFRPLVVASLLEYPNALHPDAQLRAAKFVIGAFRAAGGTGDAGVLAAGAMEVLTTAAHVLDRVADGDRRSTPADLQVAPALIFLAGRLLEEARTASGAGAVRIDWSPVFRCLIAACGGQQMDMDLQVRIDAGLDQAKLMTECKSGAFGEAMALAGAIAARGDPALRDELGPLGRLIGTCNQLIDDASDASTGALESSDIRLRKKTLPIAFFLRLRGDSPDRDRLRDRLIEGGLSREEEIVVRESIEASGSTQFALALANWYRMQAERILDRLFQRGCDTGPLFELLREPCESVGPSNPQQVAFSLVPKPSLLEV